MADLVVAIDARKAKAGAKVWDDAVGKVDRGAKRVGQSVGGVDRSMGSAGRSTGRLASAMGRLLGPMAALAAIGKSISIAAEVEATRTAFVKLVGDQERALRLFEGIRTFAAETPFQFQGLAQGARLAIAMGADAEEAFKRMKVAADASAALNAGEDGIKRIIRALGQMEAKGKVSAEEMNQLAELGVGGFEMLAKATNRSKEEIRSLAEKGLVDATRAVRILTREMGSRYEGAAKAQAEQTKGLFSTLRDNITKTAGEIGEALIQAFDLKGKLKSSIEFVKSFGGDMVAVIRHLSGVEGALDGAGNGARVFAHWLDAALPVLKAFVAVRIAEVGFNAARAFFAMTTGIKGVGAALKRSGLIVLALGLTKLADVTGVLDALSAKLGVFWEKLGGGPNPNAPTLADELAAAVQTKDLGAQVSVLERMAERVREAKDRMAMEMPFDILRPGSDGAEGSVTSIAQQLDRLNAALHNVGSSGGAGSLDDALASITDRIAALRKEMEKAAQDDIDNLFVGSGPKRSNFAERMIDQLRQEQMELTLTAAAADQYVGGLRLIEAARRDGAQNSGSLAESYRNELEQLQRVRDFRDAGEIVGQGFGQGFQSAFDSILEKGRLTARQLRDIFQGIASDIASALFNRFVVQRIVDGIASAAGGLAGGAGSDNTPRATPGNSGDFIRRSNLGNGARNSFFQGDPPPQSTARQVVITQNINTPDSRSFKRNSRQHQQDLRRSLRR